MLVCLAATRELKSSLLNVPEICHFHYVLKRGNVIAMENYCKSFHIILSIGRKALGIGEIIPETDVFYIGWNTLKHNSAGLNHYPFLHPFQHTSTGKPSTSRMQKRRAHDAVSPSLTTEGEI